MPVPTRQEEVRLAGRHISRSVFSRLGVRLKRKKSCKTGIFLPFYQWFISNLQMETNGLIVSAIYGAVTLILATQIHSRIPSPYMDEIFHVPQAQKYCMGNFKEVSKFIKVK